MATAAAVFRPGAHALITGGASGVGLAVARLCVSHGMHVDLVDTHADNLTAAKSALASAAQSQTDIDSAAAVASAGVSVNTHVVDVSSVSAWEGLKGKLDQEGRKIDLLHLNAGISRPTDWTSPSYFDTTLATNLYGVIYGVTTFFSDLTAAVSSPTANPPHRKAIIITGSKQGITNPPGNPAYNASKAALKSLAEGLSHDLAQRAPHTSAHLLVPGWTFTGLTGAGAATEKPAGAWHPDQVAEYLYAKMQADEFYVICPDGDVSWDEDRRRMLWGAGDVVFGRPPLTRWRDEWKDEARRTMDGMTLGAKQE